MDNIQTKDNSRSAGGREEISIDIIQVLLLLKRFAIIILAVALLFGIGGFIYTKFYVAPVYRSSCQVLINAGTGSSSSDPENGYISPGSMQTSQRFAKTLSFIATSKSFLTPILETLKDEGYNLPEHASYETLNSMMNINVDEEVQVLDISVESTDRALAQRFLELVYTNLSKEATSAISGASIWPMLEPPTANELDDVKQVSPSITKNTLIAAVVGLFLACAVVVVISIFDRRVKRSSDVEDLIGVPVVGRIPDWRK